MTDEQTFAASAALAQNARRLLTDAKLLLESKRYPSSVALAILAVEEVGKHTIFRWKLENEQWGNRVHFPFTHRDKQAAFAARYYASTQIEATIEICSQLAGESWITARGSTDWDKAQDFLSEGYMVTQHGDTLEIREQAAKILNAVATHIDVKVKSHPLACLMELASSSILDKQKQAALYADVDEEGACISDPSHQADEGVAAFWVDVAQVAVAGLGSEDEMNAASETFLKRYRTFAHEQRIYIASPDQWRNLMENTVNRSKKSRRRTKSHR